MEDTKFLTADELEAGLSIINLSPKNSGSVDLIVRRPQEDKREVITEALLDIQEGLIGDSWNTRVSFSTADGSPNPVMQITLMNSRVISLLAQSKERWALAGDQLFVDFDLSVSNIPSGSLLKIGSAVIEVTEKQHTACSKFAKRFGQQAYLFVNSPSRKELRLRGINGRVIKSGKIKTGDIIHKLQK